MTHFWPIKERSIPKVKLTALGVANGSHPTASIGTLGTWLLLLLRCPDHWDMLLSVCSCRESCLGKKSPLRRFLTTVSEHLDPAVPEGGYIMAFSVM